MASILAATMCIVLAAASVSPSSAMPVMYIVGDVRGWALPSGNGAETYNHWAKKSRFQVGDILDFKYAANDSVLLVNHDDYKMCSTASPLSRFTDGDTKFTFDRAGFFYFVSGVPGHCEAGQRMIVRVVAHSAVAAAPASPPSIGVGSAYSPVSAPASPSYGSSSGGSTPTSSGPSPLAQPSGASRRALAVGFSVVTCLLAGVIAMITFA
ncbi:unnamed protein product [Alopecurus aequalis]